MKKSLPLFVYFLIATTISFLLAVPAKGQEWTYAAGFGKNTSFVDAAQAIATDAAGNVYITGKFNDTINFGNGTPALVAIKSGTKTDGFVAKFNSSGLCQWSMRFGGPGTDLGGLGITSNGAQVFVTGNSAFPSTIGAAPLAVVGGSTDGVVFALDATTGNTLWARAFGGAPAGDRGQALALDAAGNLYLSGIFFTRSTDPTPTASFGTPGAFPRSVQGNMAQATSDLFVAQINAISGVFTWVSTGGAVSNASPLVIGNDNNSGSGIAYVPTFNRVVVTGSFVNANAVYSTVSPPSSVALPNAGQSDICVLSLDATSGAFVNGFPIGGTSNEEGLGLTTDGTNTFLTGYFNSNSIKGGFSLSNSNPGTDDIFYASFNPGSLAFPWAKSAGGNGGDAGLGIAVNTSGKVYVVGRYQATASFPTGAAPLTTSSAGFDDVFLLKLDATTGNALLVATGADATGGDFGFGVATAPSDNVWTTGSFFGGTINFTPASSPQTATSSGDDDVFLARFNDPAFIPNPDVFYSKSSGNLHDLTTWGVFPDGSGTNPIDFGAGKTFNLANRAGIYLLTADWIVGGLINNPSGSQLVINGFSLSEAGMSGSGTLTGSPTSTLSVTGSGGEAGPTAFTPGSEKLNNLKLDRTGGSFTLISPLQLYNNLEVVNGVLGLGGLLTLQSDAVNTARVLPIGATGMIAGNVQVQRYIPARRAWRILSAPVGLSGQTINQSWQEGVTTASPNPNPKPGFGTHITGGPVFGSVANGFDQNPGSNSSLKFYNSATDSWNNQPNTNATAVGGTAWMIFVRGDRGIALSTSSVPPTPTVLEAIGPLKTGDQTFPVSATGFTAIPNPFACPVNFATMTKTNVQNTVWLWDPKMGGTNGVGAYVTVSFNGSGWDVTPASVSPESQIIQNGQGFLVHAAANAPAQLVIKESDKSTTPNMDVFRKARNSSGLRISLKAANGDPNATVLDETFTSLSSYFSKKVDEMDVTKLPNIEENLAIVSDGQALMVERRPLLSEQDQIRLRLWNVKMQEYLFEFNPDQLSPALPAWLVDKYLGTVSPIPLDQASRISFRVTEDPSSASPDRFRIMFSRTKPGADKRMQTESFITLYPNPLEGKRIILQFHNSSAGTYEMEIVNSLGQRVIKKTIQYRGGTSEQEVQLGRTLAAGVYQLQLKGQNSSRSIKLVVNQ